MRGPGGCDDSGFVIRFGPAWAVRLSAVSLDIPEVIRPPKAAEDAAGPGGLSDHLRLSVQLGCPPPDVAIKTALPDLSSARSKTRETDTTTNTEHAHNNTRRRLATSSSSSCRVASHAMTAEV